MSMQTALDQVNRTGWDTLYGAHSRGDYTLPKSFTGPYEALRRLVDAEPPTVAPSAAVTVTDAAQLLAAAALADDPFPLDVGSLSGARASAQDQADWRVARELAADALFARLVAAISGQGAALIVEVIQPVFAERLKAFTADLAALGEHAMKDTPDVALVGETDKVRAAYLRHSAAHTWWAALRIGWAILRKHDAGVCHDPKRHRQPLRGDPKRGRGRPRPLRPRVPSRPGRAHRAVAEPRNPGAAVLDYPQRRRVVVPDGRRAARGVRAIRARPGPVLPTVGR